jgi:hypothetical protein
VQLKPATSKALYEWVGISTWTTLDKTDWVRFYNFVNAYRGEHRIIGDEAGLREYILRAAHCEQDQRAAELVDDRIAVMWHILDFLESTKH